MRKFRYGLIALLAIASLGKDTLGQSKTVNDLVVHLGNVYNEQDTLGLMNLMMPKPIFDSLYAGQKVKFGASRDSLSSASTLNLESFYDYKQQQEIYVGMFMLDLMKYGIFNIKVNTKAPQFETIDIPEQKGWKVVIVNLDHEDFRYLHFAAAQVGEYWYLCAPTFNTSKEKLKVD